jgi:CubicO group peptidase (beta-lactamase class C family)
MASSNRIRDLLTKGVMDGVYPGAALLVARGSKIIFFEETGRVSLAPGAAYIAKDTIFDLASLTKPLATTLALMKCVDDGLIELDQPLEKLVPMALPTDKALITPRLILAHSGGFRDWEPFYLRLVEAVPEKRKELLRQWIIKMPLDYRPGEKALYSDLGFMILEWVIEQATAMVLPTFLSRCFYSPLGLKRTFFSDALPPLYPGEDQFAATEDCPWRKRIVRGYVHDENAFALGGYSGHAGLFGTAHDVYTLIDMLRAHFLRQRDDYLRPETVKAFFTQQKIAPDSSWALGWDTPTHGASSSGKYFSEDSVGHLGFTGTSVWMDLKKDVIVVFLTNRIHPSRDNIKIRAFRPVLHDTVMEDVIGDGGD